MAPKKGSAQVAVPKPPKLQPAQAVARLGGIREKIMKLIAPGRMSEHEAEALHFEVEGVLEDALGEGNEGIGRILYAGRNNILDMDADTDAEYAQEWKLRADLIAKLIERIQSNVADVPAPAPPAPPSALVRVERLVQRFHRVALQLRIRYSGRPAHIITDEYDVQDLLHALLKLDFNDVRPEEATPSYAGKASRMDFLLKDEQLVVEVKMTRNSLGEKEVGSQLIEDIARYAKHPSCKTLVCFVYDPEHRIGNPDGIESDLSGQRDGLTVKVFIAPRS